MPKKITTEDFIKKAREIHGDKYDYSKVEYINNKTNVCIICPKHGEFFTTPNAHLGNKRGCRFCGYEKLHSLKKSTKDEFVKKAKIIWGDKYDYSKVVYVNNTTKVCIIDECGNEFWQTPSNHLSGYDCSNNKLNTYFFIERAREMHGEKYDYSKTKYINAKTKVCIICPEHGEFWQLPHNHLAGKGCQQCAIIHNHDSQRLSLKEFISKARKIHGNKYDYSKVKYVNNRTKVCIICPEHGEFWQTPDSHLQNHACQLCVGNFIKNKEKFISEAKQVHGNKYDYSKVEYVNNNIKICIICPEHGEFWQTPLNHLNKKQGCPKCNRYFRKKEKELYDILKNVFHNEEIIHSYYNSTILGKQEIDIYFPKYKIGIEFQGEQHFKPIDFGGYGVERANKLFEENQKRDINKKEICKRNNIKLLYYSNIIEETFLGEKLYHDYPEIIESINQVIKKENEK